MGQVIARSASPERIIDHYQQTLFNARAHGGQALVLAEARLTPLENPIAATQAAVYDADKNAAAAHSTLAARDYDSDLMVGAVLDEIWNAMGRPAQSPEYAVIAGGGKGQWTDGDPTTQHLPMLVLEKNIRTTNLPVLADKKNDWADRISAKAKAQEAAASAVTAVDATVYVLHGQQRALANLAQVALMRLKRDYKNSGMTEPQIHQIIPDYIPQPRAKQQPASSPVQPTQPAK